MINLAVGNLRQRVTLQAPIDTSDDIGGVLRVYTTVATVFGSVEAKAGQEIAIDDRLVQSVLYSLLIRWRPGVFAEHRVLMDARVFNIRSVYDPDGRRRFLKAELEEVSS